MASALSIPRFRHSPTRPPLSFPLYPLLGLVPSTYSFLCFLPSVTLHMYSIYIYMLSRSVAGRAALSEFHFRPITIHPRFKAAVHAALISAARKRIISFSPAIFRTMPGPGIDPDSKERLSARLMATYRFEENG